MPEKTVQPATASPLTAKRSVIVTDQGNGGTYCTNCSADVEKHYDACPKCGAVLTETIGPGPGFGGSDF